MRTADFDFELPRELIAQSPAEPRDSARLMVVRRSGRSIEHRVFRDLPTLLDAGDLLVLNDTRVMAARLRGRRAGTGGAAEALLVREVGPGTWETLFRPAKHANPGARFVFLVEGREREVTVASRDGARVVLDFGGPFEPAAAGEVPLPPYIRDFKGEAERYQTVYAREARSAAAPTAGLHFTPELLDSLQHAGIPTATLTLDVGPGTFIPVSVDDPRDHVMHAEHYEVPTAAADAIAEARARGGRVVAVGTTVVRTLEHIARGHGGTIAASEGWTALKILPGDPFLAVDAMVTNFHLPRSTLLMLVSAFMGTDLMLEAYREAVAHEYRFYSFGDAMLLLA